MSSLSRRSTVYFDPAIYESLRLMAANSDSSLSEIVDEAVRLLMIEDQEDMEAISEREIEPVVSYEELLSELK